MPGVTIQTDWVYIDGKTMAVKCAVISQSTSANNEIVTAVVGKKIRVTAVTLLCAGANTITFKSAATGITGPMTFAANGGFDTNRTPPNYFCETVAGEALNMTQTGATAVGGTLNYIEV